MEPDVLTQAAETSPAAIAPLPEGQAPPAVEPTAETPPPSEITDDQIEAHLAKLTHEDLKRFPAYNARMGTAIEQEQKRIQKEHHDQQERQAQFAQSDTYFKQYEADPAAFGRLMIDHPEYAQPYQEVQKWRRTGGVPPVDAEAVAGRIVDNVETHYRNDPRFSHLTDDDWAGFKKAGASPDDFFFGLIEAGAAQKVKALTEAHKKELAAKEKEWQAKYNGGADEPGVVPGTPSGTNGAYTLDQINKMTRAQREALPAGVEQAALHAAMGIH